MAVADRTNNPLNVRYSESNNWLGQTGQDSGFSSFSDENYGYRAADRVLNSYGERGINTLRDTISTFAPPSENDTEGYINYVAGQTGIGADDQINLADPDTRATVLAAMAKMESGRNITAGELRQRVNTANSGNQPVRQTQPTRQTPPPQEEPRELSFENMSRITAAQRQFDDELLAGLVPQVADPRESPAIAPDGFFETFQRGVEIGDTQFRQDMALFESLGRNLLGDTEGANYALEKARVEQATSAALSAGIQQFDEFLTEPTFDGFLNQVILSVGQITPAAAQTIVAAVATGGTAAVAKTGLTVAGKAAVTRLSKDLAAKKLRGEALDEVEEEALSGMYRLVRDNLSFKRGAAAGAIGTEYPMMSAAVYSEFDEAGVDLTPERALQSLLAGAPLAAIGVGGEALVASNVLKLAKKKAARESGEGVFTRLSKDLAKATGTSAATEGATEVIQEGALAAQRFAIDDEYTAAEAQLRLGQAAFAGFFAGGAFGGAASTPAAVYSAINSGVSNTISSIGEQADEMLKRKTEADVNAEIDSSDLGVTDDSLAGPTEEPQGDLEAQMANMIDQRSSKAGVWVPEGSSTVPTAMENAEPNQVVDLGGGLAGAMIPGRGTIISKSRNIVEEVIAAGASDESLTTVLGYSGTKPVDGDRVVQVRNPDGSVVSEEVTNEAGQAAAEQAAQSVALPGQQIELFSPEEVLSRRKQRLDSEKQSEPKQPETPTPNVTRDMRNETAMGAAMLGAVDEYNASKKRVEADETRADQPEISMGMNEFDAPEAVVAQTSQGEPASYQINDGQYPLKPKEKVQFNKDYRTAKQILDNQELAEGEEFNQTSASLEDFKEFMTLSAMKRFRELVEESQNNTKSYSLRFSDDGRIEIMEFEESDNTFAQKTEQFIRNVLTQVRGMDNRADAEGEFTLTIPAQYGGETKSGTPLKMEQRLTGKPEGNGRRAVTGLGVLAGEGRKLNIATDQALVGEGLTQAQVIRQGLFTAIKELYADGFKITIATPRGDVDLANLAPDLSRVVSDQEALSEINTVYEELVNGDITEAEYEAALSELATASIFTPAVMKALKTEIVADGLSVWDVFYETPDPRPAAADLADAKARSDVKGMEDAEARAENIFNSNKNRRRKELQKEGATPSEVNAVLAQEFRYQDLQELKRSARQSYKDHNVQNTVDPDDIEQEIEGDEDGLRQPAEAAIKAGDMAGEQYDRAAERATQKIYNRRRTFYIRPDYKDKLSDEQKEHRNRLINRLDELTKSLPQEVRDNYTEYVDELNIAGLVKLVHAVQRQNAVKPRNRLYFLIEDMPSDTDTRVLRIVKSRKISVPNPASAGPRRARFEPVYQEVDPDEYNTPFLWTRLSIEGGVDIEKPKGRTAPKFQPRRGVGPQGPAKAISITVKGSVGNLTSRIIGMASKRLGLVNPVEIVTVSELKRTIKDYDPSLVSDLSETIDAMTKGKNPVKGRYVSNGRQNIIVIRDLDISDGSRSESGKLPDAEVGAIVAHELGHHLFQQEFTKIKADPGLKSKLWKAYLDDVQGKGEQAPSQYTLDPRGFEEWYADQVAVNVYKSAQNAKLTSQGSKEARDYFKAIARKLKNFFKQVNKALGNRLDENAVFKTYMDGVVEANKNNTVKTETVLQSVVIRDLISDVSKKMPRKTLAGITNTAKGILNNSGASRAFTKYALTADDFLRNAKHGPAGKKLADLFHKTTGSGGDLGFLTAATLENSKFLKKFGDIFGLDSTSPDKAFESERVVNAFLLAENELITSEQLRGETTQAAKDALAIRALLEEAHAYTIGKDGKIIYAVRKRKDYFPRSIDTSQIADRPDEFVQFLVDNGMSQEAAMDVRDNILNNNIEEIDVPDGDPEITDTRFDDSPLGQLGLAKYYRSSKSGDRNKFNEIISAAIDPSNGFDLIDLVEALRDRYPNNSLNAPLYEMDSSSDSETIQAKLEQHWDTVSRKARLSPGSSPSLQRTLDGVSTEALRDSGFILDPRVAFINYINALTRKVEFERRGGYARVAELMADIPEEFHSEIETTIHAMLGKVSVGKNMRRANSVGLVSTVFTTLLLATVGSTTDFAGIATRSKEFGNVMNALTVAKEAFSGPELRRFAESIGVVQSEAMENAFIGLGEQDQVDGWARRANMYFFRYTGLTMYTRFVRTFAVGMGREFIISTAQKDGFGAREQRYLEELGLTREEVNNWIASDQDMDTEAGKKVAAGIARFAEESVVRPDSATRPSWANNPYFQLLFHLKSYLYAFGKTVLSGVYNETKARRLEGGSMIDAAMPSIMLGATLFPLTMMGLELRELQKYLMQLVIPFSEATPYTFKSNYMDGGEYAWEILDRSGIFGPASIAVGTVAAIPYEGLAAPFTANIPAFDMFDDFVFDGDAKRVVPVLNNIQ